MKPMSDAPRPQLLRRDSEALTGTRAVAATWVILFHLTHVDPSLVARDSLFRRAASVGYLGVDFFFILSGFIIAHQYMAIMEKPSRKTVLRYLLLRLARIYPVHLATMLAFAAAAVFAAAAGMRISADPARFSIGGAGLNILLIHAWGISDRLTWNIPSWSVSCEWFGYLGFPLLARLGRRVRSTSAAWLVAVGGLLAMWTLGRALGVRSL
jgi:peptidoglycan/LPS O-acetylase OafA/YrhL